MRALHPVQLVLLCAVYVAVAKGGLAFATTHESVSPVWPPTGVALAAVLLLGYRVWPAILAGAFIANVTTGGPLLSVMGISVGNTLEAVVGAFLLWRVANFRRTLVGMRDVLALLVLGALVATTISATIGVGSLWAGGSIPADMVGFEWRVWWLGDAAGALLIAPLILVFAGRPALPKKPARVAEALATLALLAMVSVLVFNSPETLVWAVFPILLWVAFRFRQAGAVVGSLVVAGIGVWFTARGYGPFAHESRDTALLTEQAFMGMAAVTALFAAVLGTEHQRLRETLGRLRRSELNLVEAQRVAQLGSWEWDVERDDVTWSDELYRIYGLRPQQFDATFEGYLERVHAEDRTRVVGLIQAALAEGGSFSFEERIVRPDGEVKRLLSRGQTITDEFGRVTMLGVCQDVTRQRENEEQLRHLADHDSLTGLINRRCLLEQLDREVARNRQLGGESATLVIDLDHFKHVNDTLGHAVGDHLIARIADLLRERIGPGDVLARLGGDEFGIFLSGVDESTATATAETLLATIRDHAVVASPERTLRMTASIGIAILDGAPVLSGEELLAAADIATYRAKEGGRDRFHLQGPADESDMRTRLSWSERVRDALEHDRFVLHAQPILDLRSGEVARHELLLRMFDRNELIMPSAFLHVAEEFGSIKSVDRWVIGKAIELVQERSELGEPITLEINLSGTSVTDDEVLAFIEDELARSSIDPSSLIFEVTETAAIRSIAKARQFASRVEDLGCAFALDDFGTGFGSFYYLKHLPFDYLKIDGDFIRDLPNSPTDQLTVRAIVEIAKGMGKRTIAEFVESEASLELLRGYGVDFAQGFHIGRPAPVEECWPAGSAVS
jgi:diguanylate cyclase (GGDEF)-like protein/PAS domain S-box-containing protein